MSENNREFVSTYAPRRLEDVVFADASVERMILRYVAGEDMRPLILFGPNGTGKSTIARLLPSEMTPGLPRPEIHDLDPLSAACDSGLGKRILMQIQCTSIFGGIRIYILDELNLFPPGIVRSLKSAIDKSAGRALFIATTNDIDALDRGHRSRAVRLPIEQAALDRWRPRIGRILAAEGVPIPKDRVLQEFLDNSGGDNRQLLDDLQQYVEEFKGRRMVDSAKAIAG